jgi:hypothetical protein
MKRIYSIFALVWLLVAVFVGAVVGSNDSRSAGDCGSQQQEGE